MFLGILLTWQIPSSAHAQNDEQTPTKNKPSPAAPLAVDNAAPPVQVTSPIETPKAPKYQANCDYPTDRDEAELCDQMRATSAAERSNIQGWINIALAVAGFIALVVTLHLTRVATHTAVKASEDSDKVMAVTLESVDALKRSAAATERLVAGSEITAKQSLRAYVSIESGSLFNIANVPATHTGQDHVKSGAEISNPRVGPVAKITIRNVGRTPAYKVAHWGMSAFREYPLVGEHIKQEMGRPMPSVLGPGVPGTKTIVHPTRLTEQQIADLNGGTHAIYVWGEINYIDAFGDRHFTKYSLMQNSATGLAGFSTELSFTEDGNEAD